MKERSILHFFVLVACDKCENDLFVSSTFTRMQQNVWHLLYLVQDKRCLLGVVILDLQ